MRAVAGVTDLDTLARTLALSDGIGPLTWSAMDECERMYYRREAVRLRATPSESPSPPDRDRPDALTPQEPTPQGP